MLRRRWPGVTVAEVDALEPSWAMSTEDAAELARVRRGVEPLRIVVLPQRAADRDARGSAAPPGAPTTLEPKPIVF